MAFMLNHKFNVIKFIIFLSIFFQYIPKRDVSRNFVLQKSIEEPGRNNIEKSIKIRWKIEVYRRKLKQTCGLERRQSRNARAQRNHIFMSNEIIFLCLFMLGYTDLSKGGEIKYLYYQQDWDMLKPAITLNMKHILAMC